MKSKKKFWIKKKNGDRHGHGVFVTKGEDCSG